MQNNNVLAPLLLTAADIYGQHDSDIGQTAKATLLCAAKKPLVKPAHRVPQCQYLSQAYTQTDNKLNEQVQMLESHLHWADTDAGVKPKAVQDRLAFVELVSPSGMIETEHSRIGLFFQRAGTDYPSHHHAAEELYYIISGRALWSNDSIKHPSIKTPGEFIHHKSWEPHKMLTTDEPLLTMWCWTGDIRFSEYKMIDNG